MSKRMLLVHYVLPDVYETEHKKAVCGESTCLSYIEGVNRHTRHVYVTLSLHEVNCPECMRYVGLLLLAEADI